MFKLITHQLLNIHSWKTREHADQFSSPINDVEFEKRQSKSLMFAIKEKHLQISEDPRSGLDDQHELQTHTRLPQRVQASISPQKTSLLLRMLWLQVHVQ